MDGQSVEPAVTFIEPVRPHVRLVGVKPQVTLTPAPRLLFYCLQQFADPFTPEWLNDLNVLQVGVLALLIAARFAIGVPTHVAAIPQVNNGPADCFTGSVSNEDIRVIILDC